jgi:ABC-2 type transport system ATP-binding protein
MIQVRNLTKHFGLVKAIEGVSFQIEPGEIVGFLGPNGAGKTTTIRILTGALTPTSGEAYIDGLSCREKGISVRQRIGYLPENVPLYGEMTVRRFLSFAAEAKGIPKARRGEEMDRVIQECALNGMEKRLMKFLSKGYRQRVGLAQALLNHPKVLILDEPTIGLDPAQIVEIRNLIARMAGQATVFLSTHILPEVSQLCHRVIILNKGRVVASDTPQALMARARKTPQVLVSVEGDPATAQEVLIRVPGVTKAEVLKENGGVLVETAPNQEVRPILAKALVEAGIGLLEMSSFGLSLEEVFLELVTEEKEVSQ